MAHVGGHVADGWVQTLRRLPGAEPIGRAGQGLRMQRHGQSYAGYQSDTTLWMTRSINDFEAAIMAGTVCIRANPVLRSHSAAAQITEDAAANRKWDKKKSTGRIDGMLGATMAVGAAQAKRAVVKKSFWE